MGKITDMNESLANITGLPRKKLTGTDFFDYFTEPQKAREVYQEVFAKGSVSDLPLTLRHKNGKLTDVLFNGSVYKDDRKNVLGVVIVARDVTEKKKAELEIKKIQAYTRSLIEASLDPLVTISAEGKITDVNEALVKTTGVTKEQLIDSDFFKYFTEPQKAKEGYKLVFEKGFVSDYPLTIKHISGKLTDVVYNASIYKDEQGKVIGVFAAARDVTEKKKAEDELKIKSEELSHSNQELEQFAYVASHDLQEPLRTITNFVKLLEPKIDKVSDKDTDQYFSFIKNATARMQNLIKDLLEFSRTGKGITFETVDCSDVIKEVITEIGVLIDESKTRITYSDLPLLIANKIELKRLFQNLLSNAMKFRIANVSPKIVISAEENGSEYLFSIKDNGIGIDEQFKDKLFVMFQRLHTKNEYPGTGIGLATCKKITNLHEGKIWFESKVGEGSTFYFTISKKLNPSTLSINSREPNSGAIKEELI